MFTRFCRPLRGRKTKRRRDLAGIRKYLKLQIFAIMHSDKLGEATVWADKSSR